MNFISILGGKGNHFFCTNNEQSPKVCEYGAKGEDTAYLAELRSMAHLGLVNKIWKICFSKKKKKTFLKIKNPYCF